jgi:hypothetical protein
VLEAVAQAGTYLAEGDRQTDNPARWQMTVGLADGAVRRAEALLASGEATPELAERVRQARAAADAARQRAAGRTGPHPAGESRGQGRALR